GQCLNDRASWRGAFCGLAAAALFGLSAPIAKRLLGEVSPQVLAGLLYLGAGVVLHGWRVLRPSAEAPLRRRDLTAIAGVVATGGVIGPVLLLTGLTHVSAVGASLLLNLEGPFTMAIAVLVFHEHLGRHGLLAATAILLGALALSFASGPLRADLWGT